MESLPLSPIMKGVMLGAYIWFIEDWTASVYKLAYDLARKRYPAGAETLIREVAHSYLISAMEMSNARNCYAAPGIDLALRKAVMAQEGLK